MRLLRQSGETPVTELRIEDIPSSNFYESKWYNPIDSMIEAEETLERLQRKAQLVRRLAPVIDFTQDPQILADVAGVLMESNVSLPDSDAEHIVRCTDWRIEEAEDSIKAINYSVQRHVQESQEALPEHIRPFLVELQTSQQQLPEDLSPFLYNHRFPIPPADVT